MKAIKYMLLCSFLFLVGCNSSGTSTEGYNSASNVLTDSASSEGFTSIKEDLSLDVLASRSTNSYSMPLMSTYGTNEWLVPPLNFLWIRILQI